MRGHWPPFRAAMAGGMVSRMGNAFAPVGRALPARRDAVTVSAGAGVPTMADSIIVPEARDRLLEIFDRVQTPATVSTTLEGALSGNLWAQQLLFQAMIDTWPRLQKAIREVKLAARNAPWEVMPFAPRGEKPDAQAEKLAKEVEAIVWGMKPDPAKGLKGFEGTVEELAMGYFLGHHVLEPRWHRGKDGVFRISNTKPVPPRFYGYPNWEAGEDRLMLDTSGTQQGGANFIDFPEHRFLIAVNGGHSGHPSQAAPLRVLAGYWLAAVYGLKWTMNYAQLFGIPFRWAEYPAGDSKVKAEIAAMMANIGSAGWAAFPAGTKVNFLEGAKSGSSLIQAELLKIADEQCDVFILGQTLTSSAGDKGSQSLGTVHMEVRQDLLAGVCDFVGEILTHQLASAIVAVNHGPDREDIPGIWPEWPEVRDEKSMAERDNTLGILDGKLPVEKAWLYERHNVPVPAKGAELFKDKPDPEPVPPKMGPDGKPGAEREKVEARYNPLQPRDPGGEGGGQWVSDGSSGKGSSATRGEMRAATEEERKQFGIAPAFKEAMITDDPQADLRATAKNAAGKTVYYYSEAYSKSQAAAKFARIGALHKAMPGIQARIDQDIREGGADAEQALALRMITLTGLRNGGEEGKAAVYEVIDGKRTKTGEVPTYGASSLRLEHARTEGDKVHLNFPGKKGVMQRHTFDDAKIARHIEVKRAAGASQVFDGDADKTLGYLKKISGGKFKVHDLRTWHGTTLGNATAAKIAARGELPANEKEFKAFQKRVSKVVGRALGNDPAMSLKAYIHPAIFDPYKPGKPDRKKAA